MTLTAEQANLLLDRIETKEQLLELIERVDHRVQGSVTVLYSGVTGRYSSVGEKIVHSGAMAEALHESGNDVRTIDQSEVGKFMNMTRNSSNYNKKFVDKLKQIFGEDKVGLQSFMDGEVVDGMRVNNGVWDRVSARYVADAVGEVVTFTGGASVSRVFFQTELPLILSNPRVTSIDGIPIEVFHGMAVEDAFEIITAASEVRASRLMISVDEYGNPLQINQHYIVDARNFFADSNAINGNAPPPDTSMRSMADFIPQERVAAHREALKEIRIAQDNLAVHYKQDLLNQPSQTPSRWLKALDQLGHIADVVSLAAVAHDAKAAMDAGDSDAAQRMMTQWALENAGAILAGRLASLAVAPLLAAGPLGWLAAGGMVLSASMLGSAYSDEAAEFVAEHLVDLWERGLEALRTQFQAAERTYSCPLVLDLDRNGVITSALHRSAIHFDHDGNGFAEQTGWISPTDGLLVRDLDGNGFIDHGGELFGNNTLLPNGTKAANGFEALKALDGNGDRWIDQRDAAWSTLKVWIDGNSNAVADQGETVSLSEAGVLRLGLHYVASTIVDLHGNRHLQIGEFQASDGTIQSMHDVWFQVDQARSRWLHPVSIDAGLSALPDLKGMGMVPDLHQAMAADPSGELRLLLESWIQGNPLQREALIDPLIFRWVGVSPDQFNTGWDAIDGRLAVMQRLLGQSFRQGWTDPRPFGQAVRMLHLAYMDFRLHLENQLILQTDALPILQRLVAPNGVIHSHPSGQTLAWIAGYLDAGFLQSSDFLGLYKLTRSFKSIGESGSLILASLQEALASHGVTEAVIHLLSSEHHLQQGSAESNHLSGTDGLDMLDGGAGNDVLQGGAGRDWLIAGSGNDSLNGGIGDDVYVIAQGGERKQISDTDLRSGNRDVVLFTNVKPSDVQLVERHGSQLYLHYGSTDRLWVEHYFTSQAHRIEEFQFADGTRWGDSELRDRAVVGGATAGSDSLGGFWDMVNRVDALDGDDQVYGGGFNDVLKAGNGNDLLIGHDGDDHLDGGAGNDVLQGGAGRDWLIAGSGNDSLNGGIGDDVYVIAQGGDRKQISDTDLRSGNRDVVLFTNVKPSDVRLVERHGSQLYLHYGSTDRLWVEHHFTSQAHRMEAFQFSNGDVWEDGHLRDRVVVAGATAGNDTLGGFNDMANRINGLDGHDLLHGGVLNDALTGGNGNDTLHGGDGDDILDGGAGHDALHGGRGRDRLISGTGSDTLVGGEGDDTYVIVRSGAIKTITDYEPNGINKDTVTFSNLRSTNLLSTRRQGVHLEMSFTTKDQLVVSNYFLSKDYAIEAFRFSNGVTFGAAEVLALIPPA